MRRRFVIGVAIACVASGFATAWALAASGGSSTGATVLTSATYPDATPQSAAPGTPPAVAAEAASTAGLQPTAPDGSATVLTSATYPNATPESPAPGTPSAVANQAARGG